MALREKEKGNHPAKGYPPFLVEFAVMQAVDRRAQ